MKVILITIVLIEILKKMTIWGLEFAGTISNARNHTNHYILTTLRNYE